MAEASNYGLIPITRLQAIATGKANFRITPVAEHSTLVTTSSKKGPTMWALYDLVLPRGLEPLLPP